MNAEARLAAFRRRLADSEADAFLVTSGPNMRYLTGFEGIFDDGMNAACLLTLQTARFYTDARYIEAAKAVAMGTSWVVRLAKETLYIGVCEELADEGVSTLAVESSVPYGRFRFISQQFDGRVLVEDGWVENLREVKEQREIEAIAQAAMLADAALARALEVMAPGIREIDLALEIETHMRRAGSEGVAFGTIVASGANGAMPHALASERTLREGDLVVIDLGARVDGYCSDMTRTVAIGEADARQREVYEAVLSANEAVRQAVKAGVRARDLDRAAREALLPGGLELHFTHALGHGVGISVHEAPALSAQNEDALRAGTVVTVEPAVYVAGWGGVRIEDLLVVESGGSRLLSKSPRDLIEIT